MTTRRGWRQRAVAPVGGLEGSGQGPEQSCGRTAAPVAGRPCPPRPRPGGRVKISEAHAGDLRAARAHVDQKPDQGRVAASLEVPAGAGLQKPPGSVLAHHRNRLIRHCGRTHPGHWTSGDLAVGLQPAVEHAQAAAAVGGRCGLPAGELVGDERLDIFAAPARARLLQPRGTGWRGGGRQGTSRSCGQPCSLLASAGRRSEPGRLRWVDHNRTVARRGVESGVLEPLR